MDPPENPVTVFRDVGTTVFKSGWEPDDFVFVMRTGPFINHQHMDQGSFWLSASGNLFIEERHGSTYYEDPLYQPWYTQPVAHSTILINHNHQSQRTGDLLWHVDGFDDYAFVDHFLDGEKASFSSGSIGRLYWDTVRCLKRNVLYLKPETVLMIDTIVPAERDVDVTLLYQTACLKDIIAGEKLSTLSNDGGKLFIRHLYPEYLNVKSVETPHYLYTLKNQNPLTKEGMLTVTARTSGIPLVMANLLTTSSDITEYSGEGCISGMVDGTPYAFTTRPGFLYEINDVLTDALAFTSDDSKIFAAFCTSLSWNGYLLLKSNHPVTCEISPDVINYYHSVKDEVALGVSSKPVNITLNGERVSSFTYDAEQKTVIITLPSGMGTVTF